MIEISKSFPMNTNMIGFSLFSNIFAVLCLRKRYPQSEKGYISGGLVCQSYDLS